MAIMNFKKPIEIDGQEYKCLWRLEREQNKRAMTSNDWDRNDATLEQGGVWYVTDVIEALTLDIYGLTDYKLIDERIAPWLSTFGFQQGLYFKHLTCLSVQFSRKITGTEVTDLWDLPTLEALGAQGGGTLGPMPANTYYFHTNENRGELFQPLPYQAQWTNNGPIPPRTVEATTITLRFGPTGERRDFHEIDGVPVTVVAPNPNEPDGAITLEHFYNTGFTRDPLNDFAGRIDNTILNGNDAHFIGNLETPDE